MNREVLETERVINSLESNFGPLETESPRAPEEVTAKDEVASEKIIESLALKVQELEDELQKKNEILQTRDNEIANLKGNVDVLVGQIRKLRLAQNRAQDAAKETNGTTSPEVGGATVAALEAEIKQIQEITRNKESSAKVLEQNFITQIEALETELKNKEKLLMDRDRQVDDLQSQLKTVITRMEKIASFLSQAEELAISNEAESARFGTNQTLVPADVFERIIRELTQILGPMATVIVRHDIASLGESIEKFPRRRLAELLDVVTKEITDQNFKRSFRERFVEKG